MKNIGGAELILILIIFTVSVGPENAKYILKIIISFIKKVRTLGKELREEAGISEIFNDTKNENSKDKCTVKNEFIPGSIKSSKHNRRI